MLLFNVYAPNVDNPEFFFNLFLHISKYEDYDFLMLRGDFNLVLDPALILYIIMKRV